MKNCWSPYNPEKYTVKLQDGTRRGYGTRKEFHEIEGLWNIFWLHCEEVDSLLDWEIDPELAPGFSTAMPAALLSLDELCGGQTVGNMAATLSAEEFVRQLYLNDCYPPIREYVDRISDEGWLTYVNKRVNSAKRQRRGLRSKRGNVMEVNFS